MKMSIKIVVIFLIVAVLYQDVNAQCKRNEEFRTCGRWCEPTCHNPRPRFCKQECRINVCQCMQGYYRNDHRQCVQLHEC